MAGRAPGAASRGRVGLLLALALLSAGEALALDEPSVVTLERPDVVWIPEGSFVMGASWADVELAVQLCQDEHDLALADGCGPERFAHEGPARRVYLGRFGLDRDEVSRAAYARCVAAARCTPADPPRPPSPMSAEALARTPVVGIDARDAERYCAARGGRLPSEAEWEKGARGADDARRFPWGSVYEPHLANHGRPIVREDASDGFAWLAPIGSLAGASPYGLRDMAGNAWEWTSSSPRPSDLGTIARSLDARALRVVRGGSYLHPATALRVTARAWVEERSRLADLGLRCAYDPP